MTGVARHRPEALIDRASLTGGNTGHPGQPGHGLLDENIARPAQHTGGAGPGHHLHRQNAVPAQLEKRVVDPDPLESEYLGVDAGQDLLDRGGRGAVPIDILVFGCRQGAGVEFAVDGQRQRVDHHHRGRDHVGREPLGQRGAYLGRVGGPGDIAHQALVAGAVLAGDHRRLLHPGQPGQCRLDFAELDAIPADFDLLIGAPQILQLAIGAPAHQIPGAIHACSGAPAPPNGHATNRDPVKPARRQYPHPTPAPATYNSPTTPAGTGRNHPSSTNNAAPDTGEPIGTAPDPAASGALGRRYTVVSVGP